METPGNSEDQGGQTGLSEKACAVLEGSLDRWVQDHDLMIWNTPSVKHGGGSVMVVASSTGWLAFTDHVTADRNCRMNSEVCGAKHSDSEKYSKTEGKVLSSAQITTQNIQQNHSESFSWYRNGMFFSGQDLISNQQSSFSVSEDKTDSRKTNKHTAADDSSTKIR